MRMRSRARSAARREAERRRWANAYGAAVCRVLGASATAVPGVWFALAVGLGAVAGTALLLSVTRSVFCAAYRGCRPRAPAPAAVRVTVDLAAEDGRGGYYPREGGDAGAAAAREARTNGRQAMRG